MLSLGSGLYGAMTVRGLIAGVLVDDFVDKGRKVFLPWGADQAWMARWLDGYITDPDLEVLPDVFVSHSLYFDRLLTFREYWNAHVRNRFVPPARQAANKGFSFEFRYEQDQPLFDSLQPQIDAFVAEKSLGDLGPLPSTNDFIDLEIEGCKSVFALVRNQNGEPQAFATAYHTELDYIAGSHTVALNRTVNLSGDKNGAVMVAIHLAMEEAFKFGPDGRVRFIDFGWNGMKADGTSTGDYKDKLLRGVDRKVLSKALVRTGWQDRGAPPPLYFGKTSP